MTGIDRDALLTWLTDHATHPKPLIGAVYQGIADRVRRGDFNINHDTDEEATT